MKYQLINTETLERMVNALGGLPPQREGDPDQWTVPEGYNYVPIQALPTYNVETQIAERNLSQDVDGWTVRDLTEGELAARLDNRRVDMECTPRQFRLALIQIDLDPSSVDALLAGNPASLVEWNFASVVKREHPLVSAVAGQLGKTSTEIDALFELAATL